VLRPRFIPNFSLVLDYYEITIDDVIAAVSADTAAANCVNGPSLNADACSTIFRNNPDIPFGIGARSIRSAASSSVRSTTPRSRPAVWTSTPATASTLEEMFGRDFGRLDYSLAARG
jgi:hypothetical protein